MMRQPGRASAHRVGYGNAVDIRAAREKEPLLRQHSYARWVLDNTTSASVYATSQGNQRL